MDKNNVKKLCRILGDVIATAVPIIIDAINKDDEYDSKDNSK